MLCVFRGPAASRPLIGKRQCSSILYYYPRPRYLNRWFSQSTQRPARPKRYTPEQLAAFTDHYAILGLRNNATDEEIKKAYNSLCKRFHPDMMRNVDSKEYRDNPDRPEFVKIKDAKELLLEPSERKAYDAEYNDILRALQRLSAGQRAAKGVDSKKTIASNLRLDHPTILPDGSPVRKYCVAQVTGLPPQVTAVDLIRALAKISPVGRIIDVKLIVPSNIRVERAACIEFANDSLAQHFGLLALHQHFYVLRKLVWHCRLLHIRGISLPPPPPQATRILVIDGPRDHRLMTVSAQSDFFGRKINHFDKRVDSYRVRDSENGSSSVTIEWVFTTWRRGVKFVVAALEREYPELSVSYGRDPCE